MPKFDLTIGNSTFEVEAPDEEALADIADDIASKESPSTPEAPAEPAPVAVAAPITMDAQTLEKQHQAKIKSAQDQINQANAQAQAAAQEEADPAKWSVEKTKKYWKDNPPKNIQEAAQANVAIQVKEEQQGQMEEGIIKNINEKANEAIDRESYGEITRPRRIAVKLTPEEEDQLQVMRDVENIKRSGPGGSGALEAAGEGFVGAPFKGYETPGLKEAHPIASMVGSMGSLFITSHLTRKVEALARTVPAIAKLAQTGNLGKFVARAVGKGAHNIATFLTADLAKEGMEVAFSDKPLAAAARQTLTDIAFGAGLGVVSSVSNPAMRTAATGAYGAGATLASGGSPEEAIMQGGLFIALGIFDRSNLAREEMKAAYRQASENVSKAIQASRSVRYQDAMKLNQDMIKLYPTPKEIAVEIKLACDTGRLPAIEPVEIQRISQEIRSNWGKTNKANSISKSPVVLMDPLSMLGASEAGTFKGIESKGKKAVAEDLKTTKASEVKAEAPKPIKPSTLPSGFTVTELPSGEVELFNKGVSAGIYISRGTAERRAGQLIKKPDVVKTGMTQQEADEYLKESGITLKSSSGKIGQKEDETGLENVKKETLDVAIGFKKAYGITPMITGGSEAGHAEGERSHGTGDKLDFGFASNPGMSAIVEKWESAGTRNNEGKIEQGYKDPNSSAIFWKEGNHWDVEVKPKVTPDELSHPDAKIKEFAKGQDEEANNFAESIAGKGARDVIPHTRKDGSIYVEYRIDTFKDSMLNPAKAKAEVMKKVLEPKDGLTDEERDVIYDIRNKIDAGEPGQRSKYTNPDLPVGDDVTRLDTKSTYPEWFKDKGYTKNNALAIIDKKLKGGKLTVKQQAIFDDLYKGGKEEYAREEYRRESERVKAEGISQSEIDEVDRIGNEKAQSEDSARGNDVERARELGASAFRLGLKRVPMLDKDFMEIVGGEVGSNKDKYDAWYKGWDKANLSAPMPEDIKEQYRVHVGNPELYDSEKIDKEGYIYFDNEKDAITFTDKVQKKTGEFLTVEKVGQSKEDGGVEYEVYQGKGRAIEEIYKGTAKPVAGNANYYAFSEEDAKQFGTVSKKTIALKNPLIITSDEEWKSLVEPVWPYPNLFGMNNEDLESALIDKLKKLILSKGHDSLIIKMDKYAEVLSDVFGIDQIVDYTGMENVFEKPAQLSKKQKEARDKQELSDMVRDEQRRIDYSKDMLKKGKITQEQFDDLTKQSYDTIKRYGPKIGGGSPGYVGEEDDEVKASKKPTLGDLITSGDVDHTVLIKKIRGIINSKKGTNFSPSDAEEAANWAIYIGTLDVYDPKLGSPAQWAEITSGMYWIPAGIRRITGGENTVLKRQFESTISVESLTGRERPIKSTGTAESEFIYEAINSSKTPKEATKKINDDLEARGIKNRVQLKDVIHWWNKIQTKKRYKIRAAKWAGRTPGYYGEDEDVVTNTGSSKKEKPIAKIDIVQMLETKLGTPIRKGKFRQQALGIFKGGYAYKERHSVNAPDVIRLKQSNWVGVAAHEVGHDLDKRFLITMGMKKNGRYIEPYKSELLAVATRPAVPTTGAHVAEGVAQYVKFFVVDPEKAERELPNFHRSFLEIMSAKYPEGLEVLLQARKDFERWAAQDPRAEIKAVIERDIKEPPVNMYEQVRTLFIDDLAPIDNFIKQAKALGMDVETRSDAYLLARIMRGWEGKAVNFLEKGTIDFNTGEINGVSLKSILEPLAKNKTLSDFEEYLVARRAVELHERKIETGIDKQKAKLAVDLYLKDHPEFKAVAKELYAYNDRLLQYLVDGDILSEETRAQIKALNQYHVPFYRILEEAQKKVTAAGGTMANLNSPIKKIKGSSKKIVPPIESIIKNTYAFINVVERNAVSKAMADLARKNSILGQSFEDIPVPMMKAASVSYKEVIDKALGTISIDGAIMGPGAEIRELIDQIMEELGTSPEDMYNIFRPSIFVPGENIVTVLNGGKKSFYQVKPEIYRALMSLNKEQIHTLFKIFSIPASWLRAGATLTPEFIARNPIRDQWSAYVFSKYGYVPVFDLIKGLFHAVNKTDMYYEWQRSGGINASLVAMDRKSLQKTVKALLHREIVFNPVELLRILSSFGEQGTRIGSFIRAKKSLAKKGITGKQAQQLAGYESRELTLDFSRAGATGRAINMITAFWNANIQDYSKIWRTFRNKDTRNRAFINAILGITIPSIILWLLNKDDERYKRLPRWQKMSFWIILTPNHVFRIPKPFALGAMFGSAPEAALEYLYKQDPKTIENLAKDFLRQNSPGVVPTAAIPIIENWANRSMFYDAPLVPEGRENLLPQYQTRDNTSEIMKLVGENLHFSPAKGDNLIRGYFAGLGLLGLNTVDFVGSKIGALPEKKEAARSSDIPGLRAFSVREPIGSASQPVTDFYDLKDRLDRTEASARRFQGEGNEDKAIQIIKEGGFTGPEARLIKAGYKQMSTLYDARKEIINKDIDLAKKGVIIRKIDYNLTRIAEKVLEKVR